MTGKRYLNLAPSELINLALERGEGELAANQALTVNTGKRTGRSPRDRFIVQDEITSTTVAWGEVNQAISDECFAALWARAMQYLQAQPCYFMANNLQVGADESCAVPVTVMTEYAWQQLFAQIMFVKLADSAAAPNQHAAWTILSVPGFTTHPEHDGVRSDAAIMLNFTKRAVLIAGTHYAGEIKKAMFTVLNFLLPAQQILPMHCAANVGHDGTSALFFGLSGTGKTTLSSAPERLLIGDDEHGWGERGIFNFEGGCYAKCINLSHNNEPLIWQAIRYGSVLENVVLDQHTKEPVYTDGSLSQNTRAAYPREYISQHYPHNYGQAPHAIIFLSCDLYGVLPPVARLTMQQAAYYFLSGYTAMVGSTEVGSDSDIKPVFSTCFGAPFFPRPAEEYANLLLAKLEKYQTKVYLVNTGWTGGPYGAGGERFAIPTTRSIIAAIVNNHLHDIEYTNMPVFNFAIPVAVPGINNVCWDPRANWSSALDFDTELLRLAQQFQANFAQRFANVAAVIQQAGPL
jgi:phosphoenolpyruvate carboxykinase (ATP)